MTTESLHRVVWAVAWRRRNVVCGAGWGPLARSVWLGGIGLVRSRQGRYSLRMTLFARRVVCVGVVCCVCHNPYIYKR